MVYTFGFFASYLVIINILSNQISFCMTFCKKYQPIYVNHYFQAGYLANIFGNSFVVEYCPPQVKTSKTCYPRASNTHSLNNNSQL